MSELLIVGMALPDVARRTGLAGLGHRYAFLQLAEPSLRTVLTELADASVPSITLVPFSMAPTSPARSWLGRVASHWLREYGGRRPDLHLAVELLTTLDPERLAEVAADTRVVTDRAAPLTSPAWEQVPAFRHQVFVCRGPRCTARGASETALALDAELVRRGLGDDDVLVTQTGCQFPCNHAPVVTVHPDDVWYGGVTAAEVPALVQDHLIDGTPRDAGRIR